VKISLKAAAVASKAAAQALAAAQACVFSGGSKSWQSVCLPAAAAAALAAKIAAKSKMAESQPWRPSGGNQSQLCGAAQ